ncbi:MAG: DUF4139 domain-containing protein, partial [Planctomycetota bacterium]
MQHHNPSTKGGMMQWLMIPQLCQRFVFWALLGTITSLQLPVALAMDLPEATEVQSQVVSATVYLEQADVTRMIPVQASEQSRWLRIRALPATLVPGSVRWESDGSPRVRSLQVIRQVETVDPEVRAEQEAKRDQQREALDAARQEIAVIEQDLETIEQLVNFSAAKLENKLAATELNVESIAAVADYVMQRRRKLATEFLKAQQVLARQEAEYQNQTVDDGQGMDSSFDVLILVEPNEREGQLKVSYRVDGVSWRPAYSILATSQAEGDDQFTIQLDAKVSQNSGEDWRDVELAFCTGSPTVRSKPPLMAPLRVATQSSSEQDNENDGTSERSGVAGLNEPWNEMVDRQSEIALNSRASRRQIDEFTVRRGVQRTLAEDADLDTTDETYLVDSRLSLTSSSYENTVTVRRVELSGKIYRVAKPLLASHVYRQVTLENPLRQTLVGAEATVLLDGKLVGQMKIPTTPAGGKFLIGLGADRLVRTRRELLGKEESVQGGNRVLQLRYRLVISNYHPDEIDVRLYDRLPLSRDDERLQVTLETSQQESLSTDAIYRRMDFPIGILRWDLPIPAGRFGSKAFD